MVQAIDGGHYDAGGNRARLNSPGAGRDRIPPYNLEAEESLLGAMLLSRDAIAIAVELVKTDDFYKPAHGHIFDAMYSLYGTGEPIDPVTVAEQLRRAGILDALGGKSTLLRIQAATPASANARHYAQIVEELALLRRLIGVGGEISEMGYELPDDVSMTLNAAEEKVFGIADRRIKQSVVRVQESLADAMDHIELLQNRDGKLHGMPTGFTELDNLLLGLQPSSLVVVAARPGQGKTSFALGAAAHAAINTRRPVIFFSMEMAHMELTKRLISAEARVDARHLATGKMSPKDSDNVAHAVGRLAETAFFIDDNPQCTVMDMLAKSRRLKSRQGDLGLIVVDYLHLMTSPRRAENRQVEVAEISRGLKILARELDTPVMALSQLNRSLETRSDKRPMLADLRESGAIEQDADVVLFIHRDTSTDASPEARGTAEIIVAKHRNGPTGSVKLAFLEHQTRFDNLVRG